MRSLRACAMSPMPPGSSSPLLANADATGKPQARLRRRRRSATPISVSRPASCPRTSRCCRRPRRSRPAAPTGANGSSSSKKGETVGSILRDLGAAPDDIKADHRRDRAAGARRRPQGRPEAARRSWRRPASATCSRCASSSPATAHRGGGGALRLGQICSGRHPQRRYRCRAGRRQDETAEDDGSGVPLYQSLYETALRNNVPTAVIEDLVRIYSYDVDFQRKVQPGDSFDVLYADDENGDGTARGALRLAHRRRRDQEILSLPDHRRRPLRLLRRDRQEREKIPGAQAGRRRHGDLAVRLAHASDAALSRNCTPASIGARRWARRSSPPATARSRKSGRRAATANMSASATPTATRPPTAT